MHELPYYTRNTAPAESKEWIDAFVKKWGGINPLQEVMAGAPSLIKSYYDLTNAFENTTLSPLEQQSVIMTVSYHNKCHYCIPAHTALMKRLKMPDDIIEALREGQTIPDPKIEALCQLARESLKTGGHISKGTREAFFNAGYNERQMLEVIVGIAVKILSNYTNGYAGTKLGKASEPYAWVHPDDR